MLRTLLQKKETLREKMSSLWEKREKTSWTEEERKQYDSHSSEVKQINETIKLRSEFVENFQQTENLKPEVKEFKKLSDQASVYNIIRSKIFEMTNDSRFKVDTGPIREVVQERTKTIDDQFIKAGETPVPLESFALKKRATITTGAGSAEDIKQETLYTEIVPNLYSKAWCGRAGCTMIENWRGDFVLPGEKDEPASGFIGETDAYPESSITYQNVTTLRPLKVGALQPFSLQSFLQDQTLQLQNSINTQLMKEWAKKVDDDFLNADGAPATEPKGILSLTGVQTLDVGGSADGDALSFAKCIESEGKLTENNQDAPPVWILNAKTVTHARSTLRNSVAGSLYIGNTRTLADRKFVQTNVVSSSITKGASTDLSEAILLVPSSVIVIQWAMPIISIDRSLGFKNDIVWTKISGYVNVGLKRPKDVVRLQNIKTS